MAKGEKGSGFKRGLTCEQGRKGGKMRTDDYVPERGREMGSKGGTDQNQKDFALGGGEKTNQTKKPN